MTIWIDAQLPPAIATHIRENFPLQAVALRDIGLRDADDEEISTQPKAASVVMMSDDEQGRGLRGLARTARPAASSLWLTCGNTSNARLKEILSRTLPQAIALLEAGEPLIEISEASG